MDEGMPDFCWIVSDYRIRRSAVQGFVSTLLCSPDKTSVGIATRGGWKHRMTLLRDIGGAVLLLVICAAAWALNAAF